MTIQKTNWNNIPLNGKPLTAVYYLPTQVIHIYIFEYSVVSPVEDWYLF